MFCKRLNGKCQIKIALTVLFVVAVAVSTVLFFSWMQESPDYEYLTLLDGIRQCVWYGFEGYAFVGEQEKTEIILPESLMELIPLFRWVELNEIDSYTEKCSLIYNPNGYRDNTWIAVYANGGNCLFGNHVLWSNKEIKCERGVLKNAIKTNGVKYYSVKKLPNIAQ